MLNEAQIYGQGCAGFEDDRGRVEQGGQAGECRVEGEEKVLVQGPCREVRLLLPSLAAPVSLICFL